MIGAKFLFLLVGGADDGIFERRVAEKAPKPTPRDLGWRFMVDKALVVFEDLVPDFGVRIEIFYGKMRPTFLQ